MRLKSSERQRKAQDAFVALIGSMSARAPLLVAIEDAHWIDPTSEAVLASMAAQISSMPVLFVCTHRPGYVAPWRRSAEQVTLAPLNRTESEQFISAVLGPGLENRAVLGLVAEKAQGNPLFMQELARAVGASGDDGGLPGTVHGVLMSRIDRLPRAARNLLQIASVLGREFHLRLVEQLWNNAERLDHLLAELMRLQLIYERIEADERIIVFSHALIQDAAYESLLKSRRQEMHRQAAQAIEKLFPGSVPTMATVLAHHYASGGDAANAIGYQIVAADRALQAYALAEAESLLRQALAFTNALSAEIGYGLRISAAARLSQALYLAGRFDESVEVVERETDILLEGKPADATAPCLFWLAHMLARRTRYNEARTYARAAISQAQAVGDGATVGKARGLLCLADLLAGEAPKALQQGRQSVEELSCAGEAYWMGMSEFYLGMALIVLGRMDEAAACAGRALATGESIGDRRLRAYALFLRGWAAIAGGRFSDGAVDCTLSLELAPDPTARAYAAGFQAIAWLGAGDIATALPALRAANEHIIAIGFIPFEILFAAWLAEAECRAGALAEAETAALAAISRAKACPYPYGHAHALRAFGRIRVAQGRSGESELREARALFASIGAVYEVAATPA